MTILGQTAPGDGICFRSNNVKVGADNVILRYLRFRVGAHDAEGKDTRAQDGMEITDDCENVIIDHCSVSWGTDENLSAYAVKNVTIQRSIIAEALNQSVHDKGEHSYAAIWGGVNLSIHHNLIASHKSIMYLQEDYVICNYSTISTPTIDERLFQYWTLYPDKVPEYIVWDKGSEGYIATNPEVNARLVGNAELLVDDEGLLIYRLPANPY